MNHKIFYTLLITGLLGISFPGDVSAQSNGTSKKSATSKAGSSKTKKPFTGTPGQFPESSDRMLTEADMENRTPWGLKVMMNEIYARHGYIFKDAAMKKHFRKEKWYKGKEKNAANIRLTDIETQNIAFIKSHQPKAKH